MIRNWMLGDWSDENAPQWKIEGFSCYDDYLAFGAWEDEPEPEFPKGISKAPQISMVGEVNDEGNSDQIRNGKARKLSKLAKNFAEMLNIIVVGDALYGYNNEYGAYQLLQRPERALEWILPTEQAEQLSSRDLDEIIERVKRIPQLQRSADDFNDNPWLVNCLNGIVDLSTRYPPLQSHTPDSTFSYCIDSHFIPSWDDRQAPTFEGFCCSSLDGCKEKRQLLLEIVGYICSDTNAGKCALFLKGAPDSGKSVVADLVCRLFGCDLVSNVSLHKLSDRFNKAELFGKKVNVCGEIKANPLTDISIFKMITGGDRIQAEFKGQDPFTFRPRCKLLFSGNALPGTREADSTAAFANRLVVLLFNRSIPKAEQDKELGEKLWAERDAIFSMALEAFQNLAERNFVFTLPEDSRAFINAFRYSENSARAFIEDCCTTDPGAHIFNRDLLKAYATYCLQNGLEERTRQQLYDAVDALPGVVARRFRMGDENLRGRMGLRVSLLGWNSGTAP